jgi:hypothetical protein
MPVPIPLFLWNENSESGRATLNQCASGGRASLRADQADVLEKQVWLSFPSRGRLGIPSHSAGRRLAGTLALPWLASSPRRCDILYSTNLSVDSPDRGALIVGMHGNRIGPSIDAW